MPPYQPQAPKPKAKRGWMVPVLVAVALIFGFGMGAIKPAPDPVTIEKRVEVPVEKIVTKEVPVTPAACGDYIEASSKVNDISSTVVGILSDTLSAAVNLDAATIRANNAKVDAETAKLKDITPEFQSTRDTCKASLK
jgi:hypothetical protein